MTTYENGIHLTKGVVAGNIIFSYDIYARSERSYNGRATHALYGITYMKQNLNETERSAIVTFRSMYWKNYHLPQKPLSTRTQKYVFSH